jgi:type IV secretory pathway VirB10-like protein
MVELEGMNGVDSRGMAGIRARHRENWFQYIQAGGLIAFFSVANATMVEQIARFGSDEMVASAVMGNAEFVRDIGGNLVSRAMNIQPTLTIESGEMINVMLSRNVHLPPVDSFPVTQRHVIPRGVGR